MATYQLENAHKTKLWMKVVAVLLAAVMVISAVPAFTLSENSTV